jgi:hypothetical protein
MKKLLVALFAVVTVVAVGFVLVEMRSPLSKPEPPSSHTSAFAPPPSANAPATAPAGMLQRPDRPPPIPPVPSAAPGEPDPGAVVVDGKTRSEWHKYYAERQRLTTIEILRYQSVIDRAIAGEEPDPKELGEAHDHVAELNKRLKEDIAALQRIDATP